MKASKWQLQEAKLRSKEYNAVTKPKNSFVEFMRHSPFARTNIKIDRNKSPCREIIASYATLTDLF